MSAPALPVVLGVSCYAAANRIPNDDVARCAVRGRACAAPAADTLEAGFGVVDITPKLGGDQAIWLAGLENNRDAKEIHDPLFARAVVLRDGAWKVALVSVDSIGLPRPAIERAVRRVERL